MLFQTDEIDGLLQAVNKARDNRHENIMSTLLAMYSSANSVYPMRRKAGMELALLVQDGLPISEPRTRLRLVDVTWGGTWHVDLISA